MFALRALGRVDCGLILCLRFRASRVRVIRAVSSVKLKGCWLWDMASLGIGTTVNVWTHEFMVEVHIRRSTQETPNSTKITLNFK